MSAHPTFSVVVTTYNRERILEKCLRALLHQETSVSYEVLVVDDGSTDGTRTLVERLQSESGVLRYHYQPNQGRAVARNTGIDEAHGEILCYVDSDVFVVPGFVEAHMEAHRAHRATHGNNLVFCQGLSVNVSDFERATEARLPPFDPSRAFFDTKNVSIPRELLLEAGKFDTGFVEYGWEDLELGIRLKRLGVRICRSTKALGYHYHPSFRVEDLPKLRRIEEERGRMAARFYRMHPTLEVKLMTQLTPLHEVLNFLATWGGILNERTAAPILSVLVKAGWPDLAAGWAQIILNQYNLLEVKRALRQQASIS